MNKDIIETLRQKFLSHLKLLDIFYVISGLKPVSRITIHDYEIEKVSRLLLEYRLQVLTSDFKIIMETSDGRYSNKGRKAHSSSMIPGNYFVYISKDEKKAKEAKFAEDENDHRTLGRLLGYPDCCIDFYLKHFKKEASSKLDFALPIMKNSKGFIADYKMNIFSRYIDYGVISHFPCSFQCAASLQIAKNYFAAIKKDNKEFAKELQKQLKTVAIYSGRGIYLLFGSRRDSSIISFKEIKATDAKTELYAHLMKEKQLKILDKSTFLLGKTLYKNSNIMVFE